jgi:inosine-uridine nucleoside N-ribohydrolase
MKVLIDCDTGSDDAFAIYTLIKAEEKFSYKVVAITCVDGNTTIENSALNSLMVLQIANRMDIPVYKGSNTSLILKNEKYEPFHGRDGLNDVYDKKPCESFVRRKHAVDALKDYIEEVSDLLIK